MIDLSSSANSMVIGHNEGSDNTYIVIKNDDKYVILDNNYELSSMPNNIPDQNRIVYRRRDGKYVTVGDNGLFESVSATHTESSYVDVDVNPTLSSGIVQVSPVSNDRMMMVLSALSASAVKYSFNTYDYSTNDVR